MTTKDKDHLLRRAAVEAKQAIQPILRVDLSPTQALAIIGNLQLALRHPGNAGESAKVARALVDALIAKFIVCGFAAHAKLARLGDNPHDLEVKP